MNGNGNHGATGPIVLTDNGLHIVTLTLKSLRARDFLLTREPDLWADDICTAVEVGVLSMQRAASGLDADYLQRRLDETLHAVETALLALPGRVEEGLTDDNHGVITPLRVSIEDAARQAAERTREVRDLFDDQLDPARDSSTIGRALRELGSLLDAKRQDSVQAVLGDAVRTIAEPDGSLAARIAGVVTEVIQPLVQQVDRLTLEVRGSQAAAEALAGTTFKGSPFEAETVERCIDWAAASGSSVEHVGPDNKAGDIVIGPTMEACGGHVRRIVIECRNRTSGMMGRTALSRAMDKAMATREADAAIYLNIAREGFAAEVGDWCEGEGARGPWVATTPEHLITGIRFLIVTRALAALKEAKAEVDARLVAEQLRCIRTALDRVTLINREVGAITMSASRVREQADLLRDDVRGALCRAEDAIRAQSQDGSTDSQRISE